MAGRDGVSLCGLSVLVTRPEGRADELVAAIRAAGGAARHVPLLAVAALDEKADADIIAATRERVRELDRYRRVIAVSVNAVHYGLHWIAASWARLPAGIDWYGIGAATAAALAEHGIAARCAGGDMTTEALLARPEFRRLDGESVLILRGVGGRETLAAELAARGAKVDFAECYRRRDPELSDVQRAALWQPAADAVCVNSAETLTHLWQYLPEPARRLYRQRPLLVPSARVADAARALGFERVVVAANAGTAATVTALQDIARESLQ